MSDETPQEEFEKALFAEENFLTSDIEPVANAAGKLTEASKERIKLRSQYANGMAVSLFAVGVLGPVIAIMGTDDMSSSRLIGLALTGIVCFGLSVVLHLYAAKNLGELDQ